MNISSSTKRQYSFEILPAKDDNPVLTQMSYSTGYSYYANSKRLTTEHYQCLIDRGWRRYVKPLNLSTWILHKAMLPCCLVQTEVDSWANFMSCSDQGLCSTNRMSRGHVVRITRYGLSIPKQSPAVWQSNKGKGYRLHRCNLQGTKNKRYTDGISLSLETLMKGKQQGYIQRQKSRFHCRDLCLNISRKRWYQLNMIARNGRAEMSSDFWRPCITASTKMSDSRQNLNIDLKSVLSTIYSPRRNTYCTKTTKELCTKSHSPKFPKTASSAFCARHHLSAQHGLRMAKNSNLGRSISVIAWTVVSLPWQC